MKKALKALALCGGALLVAKGFDNRLEITDYEIQNDKIPIDFDGFKIVQISDYHSDNFPGLAGEIELLNPDIIVSTGDLADDDGSYLSAVRLAKKLVQIAPVYAVTGNHDLWRSDYNEFEEELSALGVYTLHDERVFLKQEAGKIGLCGIDDPFSLTQTKIDERIKSSIESITPYDGFDVLLFHRANMLDHFRRKDFELILSGHMHGGQFRLPWGVGVVAPKSGWGSNSPAFFPKYVGGRYNLSGTDVIVNRGLGNPMIIPRIFNRPEVSVVTLRCC